MLMAEQRKAATITITKLWPLSTHIKSHSYTHRYMYSSKDTYTWMDPRAHTHANWPHLDLLLQEVDFVLLLQKLLLLPGNLRDRAHHNTLLECLCSVCVCTRVFWCVCRACGRCDTSAGLPGPSCTTEGRCPGMKY